MLTGERLRLSILGVLAALVMGCSDNDVAIYYFIENEQPTVDYSLPNESSLLGMAKSDTGNYFVSLGGSIWRRTGGPGNNWYKVSGPAGQDWVGGLGYIGGATDKLFVATLSGLYSADPDDLLWSAVADADVSAKQIVGVFVANGVVFACTFSGGSYALFSSTDGTTFLPSGAGPLTAMVADVIYSTGASAYYAVAGAQGFIGSETTLAANAQMSAAGGGRPYGGVFFDGTTYFLSTYEDGIVYATTTANWSAGISAQSAPEDAVLLTRFAQVGTNVMVGSYEHGFFQMPNGTLGGLARIPDFTASDLYNGEVDSFFVDGSDVYALTRGSGLWKATWSGTEWSDWTHE